MRGRGLHPRMHAELGVDVRHVRAHGLDADEQPRSDLAVGEPSASSPRTSASRAVRPEPSSTGGGAATARRRGRAVRAARAPPRPDAAVRPQPCRGRARGSRAPRRRLPLAAGDQRRLGLVRRAPRPGIRLGERVEGLRRLAPERGRRCPSTRANSARASARWACASGDTAPSTSASRADQQLPGAGRVGRAAMRAVALGPLGLGPHPERVQRRGVERVLDAVQRARDVAAAAAAGSPSASASAARAPRAARGTPPGARRRRRSSSAAPRRARRARRAAGPRSRGAARSPSARGPSSPPRRAAPRPRPNARAGTGRRRR